MGRLQGEEEYHNQGKIMRVLVTVTNTGTLHKNTCIALLKIQHEKRHEVTIRLPTNNPYENNLNHIAKEFLDGGYDYWLNIDFDNAPTNNPLDLVALDKDIVLLPYPQWHCTNEDIDKGNFPIVWLSMDKKKGGFKEHKDQKGLQEVDAGGSGGMLIARRVLEKMEFPFTRTFDKHGRVVIGVDFNFCDRAKKLGFEVYSHFDYPQTHFKSVELIEAQRVFKSFYSRKYAKKKSSGRDLVFYCGATREKWDGNTHLERGIAGSEESVIYLAPELAKLGWNVSVYNDCKEEIKINGVNWIPYHQWNRFDKQDVTVVWRKPQICNQYINSEKIIVDLHDVGVKNQFLGLTKKVNKIFVRSKYHKSLYNTDIPMSILPLGICKQQFIQDIPKDPYLLVNTSAPDRSLGTLIKLFRRVKKQVPKAKLSWAYGWSLFDDLYSNNRKMMAWKELMLKAMEKEGIFNYDRIKHQDVANMYQEARVFAYPTTFPEVYCLSAVKAQYAGAIPVTTDSGALKETVKGYKIKHNCKRDDFDFGIGGEKEQEEWVDRVVSILNSKQKTSMLDTHSWQDIAKIWDKEIK